MNSTTLEIINERLKDKPEKFLRQVLGYLDGIFENEMENSEFQLNSEQKESLDKIKNRPYSEHTEIESFVNDFKSENDI